MPTYKHAHKGWVRDLAAEQVMQHTNSPSSKFLPRKGGRMAKAIQGKSSEHGLNLSGS